MLRLAPVVLGALVNSAFNLIVKVFFLLAFIVGVLEVICVARVLLLLAVQQRLVMGVVIGHDHCRLWCLSLLNAQYYLVFHLVEMVLHAWLHVIIIELLLPFGDHRLKSGFQECFLHVHDDFRLLD